MERYHKVWSYPKGQKEYAQIEKRMWSNRGREVRVQQGTSGTWDVYLKGSQYEK